MLDRVFIATLLADVLFLASGAVELGFAVSFMQQLKTEPQTGREATRHMLYQQFPITVAIVNAAFILATCLSTIPGLISTKRSLLKYAGYAITFCGLFTMCVGLYTWILTLRIKETLAPTYFEQDPSVQSLIQTSFQCCGYNNYTTPAFVTNSVCSSPAAAALTRGCSTFVSSYANTYVDRVFTALFGMVGVDALLILAIACLLKTRKERERYRLIDEKSGYGHF
ncbi:hypothetical protein PT974_03352 [Cladobotryum mycophilum]|uniref:Tetraspanin n=1 Tax=Cladobotryum mycophilum TaxID=491253 RepID=A0ABR0SS25_9HYPO